MIAVNYATNAQNDGELDLCIAPCLAIDKKGNRLGYGGGFYDRFLSNYGGKAIVLCYKEFVFDRLPCGEHDVQISEAIIV